MLPVNDVRSHRQGQRETKYAIVKTSRSLLRCSSALNPHTAPCPSARHVLAQQVSVSIDYAYAMTTLGFLCQVFIGVVALPKPSMWCPSFCKAKHGPGESRGRAPRDGDNGEEKAEDGRGRARSQFRPLSGESHGSTGSNIGRRATEARRSNTSSERNRSSDASVEVKRRSWGRATRGSPPLGGLDPSMVRDAICDPV